MLVFFIAVKCFVPGCAGGKAGKAVLLPLEEEMAVGKA